FRVPLYARRCFLAHYTPQLPTVNLETRLCFHGLLSFYLSCSLQISGVHRQQRLFTISVFPDSFWQELTEMPIFCRGTYCALMLSDKREHSHHEKYEWRWSFQSTKETPFRLYKRNRDSQNPVKKHLSSTFFSVFTIFLLFFTQL
uniref:Uncharacterized protein n=1 Tax=Oryzias latipes TaxID=8090 RepID=A0A3P9I7F2_ORYLA